MAPRGFAAIALYGFSFAFAAESLTGLGLAVTIAGVAADAARVRGGALCAFPGTAGAGGAPS